MFSQSKHRAECIPDKKMIYEMDIGSLLTAMTTTGVVSITAAQYLSKRLLDHRLSKDLKDYDAKINETLATHKAALDQRVNTVKAEGEAQLKKEIEEYLGEKTADRTYRSEARKRLYLAVGPLRYQLLIAAAELTNRVTRIGDAKITFDMSIKRYFGQSTAYRMLRVLAVSELIERQIAYADFAVAPAMRSLLKFKRQAFMCLSSGKVSLGHPNEDWNGQTQHIFYDVLGMIASNLTVQDSPNLPERIMRFDEFADKLSDRNFARQMEPVPHLITGFVATSQSILWLRLLALAQLCIGLLENHGTELDLEIDPMNVDQMIRMTEDDHILRNIDSYREAIVSFRTSLVN
ncbi:hypothetical protein [Pseudomonas sp. URMO17WK12:I11]|uniref:hypothetical protein n=1 Tax=Pseudomonas sp. URMO17WK12:I11 TaxID=1283291 RepID=UPI0012E3A51A|nr:hypothetical protein [Pseudomonas sp. URMO17WK12:I11]